MQVNAIKNNNIHIANSSVKNTVENKYETNSTTARELPSRETFGSFLSGIFTEKFSTPQEKQMFDELNSILVGKDKKNLNILYKTGRLSDRNSNDNSSTLENLYKIYTEPRAQGLDSKKILSDTIERISNPFVINQKFGEIPNNIKEKILTDKQKLPFVNNNPYGPKKYSDMDIKNSASCVAASIEFSLADKKPAEFARFAQGLTSKDIAVKQKINLKNLNANELDAIYLLKMFNVKTDSNSWDNINIVISPDKDAIVRARVQSTQYNGKNRSSVDVLMQSAFMQLGSQSTYNSLIDKRYGSLNSNDTGLTEFEKTFVESVIGNDGEKTSIVYQNVDENGILTGYFHEPELVQQHLIATLDSNKNVIIGITETDENKKIIGGHEITVVGYKMRNNELYFIYNDTDDNYVGALEISAKNLIPKIHHAGIPAKIAELPPEENRGLGLLKDYVKQNNVA